MFNLANVFQFIVNCFDYRTFTKHNFMQGHGQQRSLLKFYKPVIGYSLIKIFL